MRRNPEDLASRSTDVAILDQLLLRKRKDQRIKAATSLAYEVSAVNPSCEVLLGWDFEWLHRAQSVEHRGH